MVSGWIASFLWPWLARNKSWLINTWGSCGSGGGGLFNHTAGGSSPAHLMGPLGCVCVCGVGVPKHGYYFNTSRHNRWGECAVDHSSSPSAMIHTHTAIILGQFPLESRLDSQWYTGETPSVYWKTAMSHKSTSTYNLPWAPVVEFKEGQVGG